MKARSDLKDLTGQRFGKWTVLEYAGGYYWRCRCDCGSIKKTQGGHLRAGRSVQCKSCATRGNSTKHNESRTKEYSLWRDIQNRCHNPRNKVYKNYGGRGIYVCDRWRESYEAFKEDMGPKPSPELTLDRIDNEGPYSPENCRWATRIQQGRNTRRTRWLEYGGERMILKDWAAKLGLTQQALLGRFAKGWSMDRALTEPGGSRRGPQKNW